MSWVKIDDRYATHPKILRAGPTAMALDIAGMCYAAQHETDGHIPVQALGSIAPFLTRTKLTAAVATLCEVGRWVATGDGWQVHDFLAYNPSAAQRAEQQAARQERQAFNSRRMALYRDKDLRQAVRERDKDHCRYCGQEVRWRDRRGPLGGTYDHVDPKGSNSPENLVVACRGCNSSKRGRTPTEAGMVLLPIYSGSVPRSSSVLDISRPRPAKGGAGIPPLSPPSAAHDSATPPLAAASPTSATPSGDADSAANPKPTPTSTVVDPSNPDQPNGQPLPAEAKARLDALFGADWRHGPRHEANETQADFETKRERFHAELDEFFAQNANETETETEQS